MTKFKIILFIILIIASRKVINALHNDESDYADGVFGLNENNNLQVLINGIVDHLLYLKQVNCLTIISDSVYLNVFSGQWFSKTNSVPILMIVVEDHEDLLSPNYDTLEALRQSRKDGCNLHIILISNGIQTRRFFTFADRYRLINTRANFILLHDLRLFSSHLHYIWTRIINTVFIRHHQKYKNQTNSTSWYELSTVPFPSPIQNVLVPKRLYSWKTDHFFNPSLLFPDKTSDLKGHPINVVAFEHIPAIVKIKHENGNKQSENDLFNGIEMEIMRTLSSLMNFKPKLIEPLNANVEKWGKKQTNGSYTGLMGKMVDGLADIALGNLHYTPHHLQLTDLTIPYISQCLTFLTPESLTDNSWKTLILPFKLYMWIAVLLVLMVTGFIFYLLAQFHKRIQHYKTTSAQKCETSANDHGVATFQSNQTGSKHDLFDLQKKNMAIYLFEEFSNSVLYTYGMLLVVSLPQLPLGWSIRVLTGWYWIYCVLVVTSYRASMTAILANPAPRVTIDTLNQLADSTITCGGWGYQNKDFFTMSLDEIGQKIGRKFEIINNPIKAVEKVIKGDLAYYENVYFLRHLMVHKTAQDGKIQHKNNGNNTQNKEESKDENLHIMRECAIHMPISLGLQKNSPLKFRIDKLLRKIVEAGLVEKWLNDVMIPIYSKVTKDEENIKAEINLKKLYAGFIALGVGYGLGLMTLLGEIVHWRYVILRDPNYDIYARYEYFKQTN